ncbi:unnamed protein product [Rotaria sp. Silwood1]|nr:unnamed protein product [Rotaria sp. Silwood1]CAF1428175.1 unnamed protein product [Rotaria sp. Silwood1]CAF3665785.1 unnamed protein product [Rotaria sp. Silwood1]CAF3668170.1 unnamed protein product [Rotaria sp. Silwood1]CAF4709715.1 unnamed protein product [Rotaria sp. Silwood1]
MIYGPDASKCPIKKQVLNAGKEPSIDFVDEMKIFFHFLTTTQDGTVIDDSRKYKKPMEITLGHKFKLDCWETCLKTMRLGEIAKFSVDKELIGVYPAVAKQIRDYYKNQMKEHKHDDNHENHHCCGFMALEQGLGHQDLDKLMRHPEPLDFTFELIKVLRPGEFEKDTYLLNDEEKQHQIPDLKLAGNNLYNAGKFEEAANKYGQALQFFEDLMLKEKPNDVEWRKLDLQRRPLLLNFIQCKLKLGDFYSAIEHATTILDSEPTNIKARYRRAKAHVGVWNIEEAKNDYKYLLSNIKNDDNLHTLVQCELQQLIQAEHEKYQEDKSRLSGKLFS